MTERYPHCSTTTIHAPGECEFCDDAPKLQAARAASGEPFTPNIANGWAGNVAQSKRHVANVTGDEFATVRDPGFYQLRHPQHTTHYLDADGYATEQFYRAMYPKRTRLQRVRDRFSEFLDWAYDFLPRR